MIQVAVTKILKLCAITLLFSANFASACESSRVISDLETLRTEMVSDYELMSEIYATEAGQEKLNHYSQKISDLAMILAVPGDCSAKELEPIEFDVKHVAIYLNKIGRGEFNLHN
jgi:hypothetical protein